MENTNNTFTSLLSAETIAIAQKPADNPQKMSTSVLSATFIEHDYPGKTPSLWNAVYRAYDIDAESTMFVGATSDIAVILQAAKNDERYVGGGMGVGFKDAVIEHLDELDPLAKAIGAVNLVVKTGEGLLRGYNTDGVGYRDSLIALLEQDDRDISKCTVLILGAGGTANAIAMALAESGATLMVLNRTVGKAEELCERVNTFVGKEVATAGGEEQIPSDAQNADVIINVSTKGASGMFEEFAALAPAQTDALEENLRVSKEVLSAIPKSVIVSDVILGEKETPTLTLAREAGLTTLDGTPMVVNQGIEAIWIVHGDQFQTLGVTKEDIRKVFQSVS